MSSPVELNKNDLYIELSDGSKWYPGRPDNQVSISALAHALSNLCRFTGHGKRFYSVAEHSVKVSLLVPNVTALLHDAHEALVNDIAKPIKVFLAGSYEELEHEAERQIADQYGLSYPHGPEIKEADILMCLIESFDLLPSKGRDWGYYEELRPKAMELYVERPELRVEGWPPSVAKDRFLQRYNQLTADESDGR